MARIGTMGGDGTLFVGEDKTCRLEVLDATATPVDLAGWTVQLVVKNTAGHVLLSKQASISGSYTALRSTNTQRAVATLSDDDLSFADGTHRQSWKRLDAGQETVLFYGPFILERATQV
jgi:hypothetical protein